MYSNMNTHSLMHGGSGNAPSMGGYCVHHCIGGGGKVVVVGGRKGFAATVRERKKNADGKEHETNPD